MKKIFLLLVISLFIIYVSLLFPCHGEMVCTGISATYFSEIGLWFLIMIILGFFALSLNSQKHKIWLVFTGIFFVVSMVLVFITPEYGHGIVSIDRELVNWFFAGLYSLISIIYFIVQHFKKDNKVLS